MTDGSTWEFRSDYENEKVRYRFQCIRGQKQGAAKSLPSDFIPEYTGTYAYPVHIGQNRTGTERGKRDSGLCVQYGYSRVHRRRHQGNH